MANPVTITAQKAVNSNGTGQYENVWLIITDALAAVLYQEETNDDP